MESSRVSTAKVPSYKTLTVFFDEPLEEFNAVLLSIEKMSRIKLIVQSDIEKCGHGVDALYFVPIESHVSHAKGWFKSREELYERIDAIVKKVKIVRDKFRNVRIITTRYRESHRCMDNILDASDRIEDMLKGIVALSVIYDLVCNNVVVDESGWMMFSWLMDGMIKHKKERYVIGRLMLVGFKNDGCVLSRLPRELMGVIWRYVCC